MDLGRGAVAELDVRARVAEVADGAEVQHHRPPLLAHQVDRAARVDQQPVGPRGRRGDVLEAGQPTQAASTQPSGVRVLMPSPLSSHDDQQRDLEPAVVEVRRGVERALRGRVVDRGVAERAHDDRVLGPDPLRGRSARLPSAYASPTARGRCEAIVDVCGTMWRSRVPEHLVPAARDRVVGGGAQAEQHVAHRRRRGLRVLAGVARRPRGVEPARPVVQQRRVVDPRQQPDRGVGLVARRADRVEPLAPRLQPPRREVEVPRLHLRLQQLDQQRHVGGIGGRACRDPGRAQTPDPLDQVLVDRFRHGDTLAPPGQPAVPSDPPRLYR